MNTDFTIQLPWLTLGTEHCTYVTSIWYLPIAILLQLMLCLFCGDFYLFGCVTLFSVSRCLWYVGFTEFKMKIYSIQSNTRPHMSTNFSIFVVKLNFISNLMPSSDCIHFEQKKLRCMERGEKINGVLFNCFLSDIKIFFSVEFEAFCFCQFNQLIWDVGSKLET